MRNNWFWLDLGGGPPYIFPVEPLAFHTIGNNVTSHIASFMENLKFRHFSAPGSSAIDGAFNQMGKLGGALVFALSGDIAGNPNGSKIIRFRPLQRVKDITIGFKLTRETGAQMLFGKAFGFLSKLVHADYERLRSHSVLSLASVLAQPFDTLYSKILAVPTENDVMLHRPCEVHRGQTGQLYPELNWRKHEIEPRTGIEFPVILGNGVDGENNSNLCSEILVGTGSRTMTVVKIKSLKLYAFGFYIHPSSVCEKLGPRYGSSSAEEIKKRQDFYRDLLREDISMTVRLVVNCNGLKINTVRDTFEKSLRARLLKANPSTDFECIRTFSSCFTKDIPLPVGTIIDVRRTSDGHLITEIGGNQVGAVQSRDLCRAFFSLYIGDLPVSEQAKEDIGKNVANMMRRC